MLSRKSNGHSASAHVPSEVALPGELAVAVDAGELDDAAVDEVEVLLHGALQAEGLVAHGALEGVEARVGDHVALQLLLQRELVATVLHQTQTVTHTGSDTQRQ